MASACAGTHTRGKRARNKVAQNPRERVCYLQGLHAAADGGQRLSHISPFSFLVLLLPRRADRPQSYIASGRWTAGLIRVGGGLGRASER